jgi:signal transduction histidine kinase
MEENEVTILVIAITIILVVLGFFILSFFLVYKKRQNIQEDKLEQLNKALLESQVEIQEQTLKTISQEIHDNIGQVLSLAKLNLSRMDINKQDQLQEKIADSKNLVSKAIQDLRDLARSMNTDNITAIGLSKAVEYEVEMIRKAGFSVSYDIKGDIVKQEPQKELILFRIIQEIFNNIIKHAEASIITIVMKYEDQLLTISIADNGKGFDLSLITEKAKTDNGLGIRNMHNRARLIGADFKMNSTLHSGTEIILTMPLKNFN